MSLTRIIKTGILTLAMSSLPAYSAPATGLRSTSLHIVSFNIKGLPSFVMSGDYKDSRYPLIGKLLSGVTGRLQPAIVLLQEAFASQTSELLKAANYPHKAEGPGVSSFLGVNSGLFILSRFPIVDQDSVAFGSEHCVSWDCFANKGVQFARIDVPGLPHKIEIFNTHLQAGREDGSVRRAQVKILLDFFRKRHLPGSPVIFAGDFNFRPGLGQQSYLDFAEGTELMNAGKYCLEHGLSRVADNGWHGIWDRAVDHHFFSKEGPVKIVPTLLERNYRDPVESLKLSDHPTYEVHYDLRWRDPVETRLPATSPSL